MNNYKFSENPHGHFLNSKQLYGVTTILEIMAKNLQWWSSGLCAAEFGWTNSKKVTNRFDRLKIAKQYRTMVSNLDENEYLDYLDKAYRAHNTKKEKRAEEGTDIHALVEAWIITQMTHEEDMFPQQFEAIKPFINWCKKNVKRFLFSEIHCYSESLWVGGKTDFGYEDMNGDYVLADVKSRDKLYFSDYIQCGGYNLLLKENGGFDKNGNKIFTLDKPFKYHAMFPVNDKFERPFITKDVSMNEYGFISAVQLYKLKQKFEDSQKGA